MLAVTFDDTEQVKAIKGVKGVQRIVCGGCQDFKVGFYRDISFIRNSPPPRTTTDPGCSPTVWTWDGGVSYERGTPIWCRIQSQGRGVRGKGLAFKGRGLGGRG